MKKYAILDSNVREGDFCISKYKIWRTSGPGLTRLEINKLGNKKFRRIHHQSPLIKKSLKND